ncbi:TonB-dependent receptor [Microbulbifer rhizosphaerae]|uniref:TonB-dependent receptor n=1 Tax=Microbulbifer rhizosphaerae TaxID=1562603 RepID=A0A7W4WE11_9GAMM|nr:TonB-dependent receptor [Microbulbifer rhizosphaerae]MBB3062491.1 TonB-dependent receptor [Microbulbifer rhizosphaerae]
MYRYKRNKLSEVIITVMASAIGSHQALAQEQSTLEEVTVTGIRASLERSMDIKRESSGVVDAISAEDIGKFPDTNLAESLQRITGVSINRVNGEGSEVTVRGFGPENNMVTLNGRTMPTGTSYGGGSGADGTTRSGGSRAFNFANLASENISGVEVYKTSKADIATGGIGSTINIKTMRPLDNPGFTATIGAKAVHDTTNRYNDDVTPELSGIVSWTNEEETWGAALALSHQQRDSGYSGVTVNNWNIGVWGQDDLYSQGGVPDEDKADIVNAPAEGQLYARPNDFRYAFSDTQRERLNGQLTLQFKPTDKMTATLDYTYADNDIEEHRGEITNWIQNGSNVSRVVFDDSEIATPISISENYTGTVDIGYEQQYRSQSDTLDSLGFNFEFEVNDSLTLAFDVHDSTMKSLPTGPDKSGEVAIGLGSPTVGSKTLDFSGSTPTYSFDTSVPNNALTADNVGSSILRVRGSGSTNDVTQLKFDGKWEFDNGRFDFGVESRSIEMDAYQTSGVNQTLGNWGIANPGEFPADMFRVIDVQDEFEDFNVNGSPAVGFRGDAVELTRYANTLYPGTCLCVADTNSSHDILEEETTAAYFQVALSTELGAFPANFLAGARYETTDVSSQSLVNPIPYLVWENNNDFSSGPAGATVEWSEKNSYDNLLPSLDFSLEFTEDVVGRFSYSKTIARAGYGDLRVAPGSFGTDGSTFNGATPTATSSNPSLLPLESDNLDLSLEWYYGDSSFASLGFFEKRVDNFIGIGQEEETFGILDQTNGPRVQAAAAALDDLGLATDDTNLYAMVVLMEHPEAITDNPDIFPNGVFEGTNEQLLLLGETDGWDVTPEEGDPEMVFTTSKPINNRQAKIYGAELAVQHFFGETGFGVQANYTIVRGDVGFDNLGLPTENQFALTGLSDTANLVLLYENYGIQARLAYNWRDKFLTAVNQGSSRNPRYIDEFSQIDLNVSYEVNDQLSVAFEGINITGEDIEQYNRNERMVRFMDDLGARYQVGAHYKF